MEPKSWLIGTVAACALSITAVAAQAAPIGSMTAELKATNAEMTALESVATYRRCSRHHGRRVCRLYQYEYDLRSLPYGKRIWWEQYDRERGGGRRR